MSDLSKFTYSGRGYYDAESEQIRIESEEMCGKIYREYLSLKEDFVRRILKNLGWLSPVASKQLHADNQRLRDALKEAVRIANATMTCCYAGSEDPYPLNEELKRLEQDQADWGRE